MDYYLVHNLFFELEVLMKSVRLSAWWTFVCRGCGAVCMASPSDVTTRDSREWNESPLPRKELIVRCGLCKAEREVPSDLVTDDLSKLLD